MVERRSRNLGGPGLVCDIAGRLSLARPAPRWRSATSSGVRADWHERILAALPKLELYLLVGQYAQARYLSGLVKPTLTETARAFRDYLPNRIPLPHPSWRSKTWMKKNLWFEEALLPELRRRVAETLDR